MTSQTSKNVSVPVLTGAFLTMFLAGCNAGSSTIDTPPAASSSSAPAMMQQDSSSSAMMQTSSSNGVMQSSSASAMTDADTYKDGTYSAEGMYRSPAGSETVQVTLVLKDDTIVGATFTGDATHKRSIEMQGKFAAGFNEAVVGKSIDSLALTIVNGSSLTPAGFMDALAQIKVEAKA